MLVTSGGLYHLPVSPANHSLLHEAPRPILSPPTKKTLCFQSPWFLHQASAGL